MGTHMADKTKMVEVINRVLDEKAESGLTAKEIMDLSEDGCVEYQVRYYSLPLRTKSVLGNLSTVEFEDMVRAWHHQILHHQLLTNQDGDWYPFAWHIEHKEQKVSHRVTKREKERWNKYAEGHNPGGGTPSPQNTEMVTVMEAAMVVHVAFVEASQQDPQDNWLIQTGRTGSKMYKFAQTRLLKHLPRALRAQRKEVEMIVDKVSSAPIKKKAGGPKHRALSPELMHSAQILRNSGMKWGDISKALDIPWQTIRSAMESDDVDQAATA